MLDLYPSDGGDPEYFRTYETGVSLNRFKAICVAATLNHLNATYP